MSNRSERRRQAREGNDSNSMKVIVGLVVVVLVAAGAAYAVSAGGSGMAATEPVEVDGLDDMETLVGLAQGVTKGDPDAPITVVEFGDYQCPGCMAFASSIKPQIERQLVQPGTAKFVFYDLPLVQIHNHAFLAARAARCAEDQDRFWEYHDNLFRNQSSWSGQTNPVNTFVGYAGDLGLDEDDFEDCLKSDRHAELVTANMRLAYELGLSGTPSVMVSSGRGMARRLQSNDFTTIRAAVEALLAEQAAEGEGEGAPGNP